MTGRTLWRQHTRESTSTSTANSVWHSSSTVGELRELDHAVMMTGRMCPGVPQPCWQHKAASIVHDRLAESIWPGLTDSQRAPLRSQGRHMASSPFTTPPASFRARFDPQMFRVLRLWQPLPPVSRIWLCVRPLDSSGHHRQHVRVRESLAGEGLQSKVLSPEYAEKREGASRATSLCGISMWVCQSRETPGIGDRWPSSSVGLGCHLCVCIAVRWNPTQACSGRG